MYHCASVQKLTFLAHSKNYMHTDTNQTTDANLSAAFIYSD